MTLQTSNVLKDVLSEDPRQTTLMIKKKKKIGGKTFYYNFERLKYLITIMNTISHYSCT